MLGATDGASSLSDGGVRSGSVMECLSNMLVIFMIIFCFYCILYVDQCYGDMTHPLTHPSTFFWGAMNEVFDLYSFDK